MTKRIDAIKQLLSRVEQEIQRCKELREVAMRVLPSSKVVSNLNDALFRLNEVHGELCDKIASYQYFIEEVEE